MSIKHHTHPDQLERYSFVWSQTRLVIAAVALFLGGYPPVLYFLPTLYGITLPFLHLSWIVSGVASAYLLYRWHGGEKKLFGGRDQRDTYAFFVSVISGINLGLAGLLGQNIGMSVSYGNQVLFVITGAAYLWAAWHLRKRWSASGEKMFT
ncbi:MAG: hypothetical protein RL681_16 [Candidatus Parcubacteria bacterium]|jgi:uncharacterized membrane protein YuzA (DUF378 family)